MDGHLGHHGVHAMLSASVINIVPVIAQHQSTEAMLVMGTLLCPRTVLMAAVEVRA